MKKSLFILVLVFFCINCKNKYLSKNNDIDNVKYNNDLTSNSDIESETTNLELLSINDNLYVIPFEGINLRSEPNLSGTIINLIPHSTKLDVLERSKNIEIINELNDHWYMVEFNEKTGWVFGGYLSHYPIVIKNNGKNVPKFIYDFEISTFSNGIIFYSDGGIQYNNKYSIQIHESNTTDSTNYFSDHDILYLFKIEKSPGWFYSISKYAEALGYVYIYNISEKSFFGNLEENEKSGNIYTRLLNIEHELLIKNDNIKRYGPLLQIKHNNKNIEFLDDFNGRQGVKYQLLDYFSEYDEIILRSQYYEGATYNIYNLVSNEYRCELYNEPYFNFSRTYLFSFNHNYSTHERHQYSIKIFKINNGYYENIYDEIINFNIEWSYYKINWVNDHEVHIYSKEEEKIIIIEDDAVTIM